MRYFLSRLRHKWFVFLACRQLRVPLWQSLIHDLSRFSPQEVKAFSDKFNDKIDKVDYARAWLHHQNHNPHHWEYWSFNWLPIDASFDFYKDLVVDGFLEMPERYIREMIADMMGASREYTGSWDISDYLKKGLPRMGLHPKTREKLLLILKEELEVDI